MGLIHSRAAKQRNRAAAELLREQARTEREGRHERRRVAASAEPDMSLPWWRQPTLGQAIRRGRG